MHILPSFFIIGERKCGTSSLYRYLLLHPEVLPCKLKEPNFFGQHDEVYIESHIGEYFSLFPKNNDDNDLVFSWPELNKEGILYHEEVRIPREVGMNYITGEASANTFADVKPELLKKYLPDVKLIVLLRNPVERAYSHHRMYQRFQAEGRDLGFEVKSFAEDVALSMQKENIAGTDHYLGLGLYLERLKKWLAVFGKDQLQVFFAEELQDASKAKQIMFELENYLGVSHYDFGEQLRQKFNVAPPSGISMELRRSLEAFFEGANRELEEYLGKRLPW